MGKHIKCGLYIHIPFCVRKCAYCDFLSVPIGNDCCKMPEPREYIQALINELEQCARSIRQAYGEDSLTIDTIFIGGGTPSCIEPSLIGDVLKRAHKLLNIAKDSEVTMECNPATVTAESMSLYRDFGINRISIGIQSMNNRLLRVLGRIHNAEQASETVRMAQQSGINNINVDLITGIHGVDNELPQTLDEAMRDIDEIIKLNVQHISVYSLITEPDTALCKMQESGRVRECGEDIERAIYHGARRKLREAGYIHYEISNYAKEGYQCRHNIGYWICKPYIGIGAGSASYMKLPNTSGHMLRHANTRDIIEYTAGRTYGDKTLDEHLDEASQKLEYMMLGFRMIKGADPAGYERRFPQSSMEADFGSSIKKLQNRGLINIDLSLTERGMDYANEIFREFI